MLPNRTVIYPANLLSHRQTQASVQTLAKNWRGKTLWLQHTYEQTHVHACVCDSEKTAILTVKILSLIPSAEIHHHLFAFFGYIKLGILKACFLVCVFFFFSPLHSKNTNPFSELVGRDLRRGGVREISAQVTFQPPMTSACCPDSFINTFELKTMGLPLSTTQFEIRKP